MIVLDDSWSIVGILDFGGASMILCGGKNCYILPHYGL